MRRRQILEATLASIEEKGLSGTTLASVATRARLSQGSTVFYFETKEQLFTEAFRLLCEDYRASWMEIFDADYANPLEQLLAFIFFDLDEDVGPDTGTTAWFAFWGEARTRPAIAEIAEGHTSDRCRALRILTEKVADKMATDHWTIDAFVRAIEALCDGLWLQVHIANRDEVKRNACETMAAVLKSAFPGEQKRITAAVKRIVA
ncbi:MAG: TetR family transcriptional regulator C-terminal domain-containing protein [Pseudomonadota bacterium]